jgi:hypothetical protein
MIQNVVQKYKFPLKYTNNNVLLSLQPRVMDINGRVRKKVLFHRETPSPVKMKKMVLLQTQNKQIV